VSAGQQLSTVQGFEPRPIHHRYLLALIEALDTNGLVGDRANAQNHPVVAWRYLLASMPADAGQPCRAAAAWTEPLTTTAERRSVRVISMNEQGRCPKCAMPDVAIMDLSRDCSVDYYRCELCLAIWTTRKGTRDFIRLVTVDPTPTRQRRPTGL
jgi:hypothetical protein